MIIKKILFTISIICSLAYNLKAQTIAAGGNHSLSICMDSTIKAWGYNLQGQLGDSTNIGKYSPIEVVGIDKVVSVAAGNAHSLAIKADQTMWAWGDNNIGQLGDGTTINRNAPTQVQGLSGIAAGSAGYFHTIALKNDSTVWAFGYNNNGQIGDGSTVDKLTPTQVTGLTQIIAISAGQSHNLALKSDGTIWAWGNNWKGQLGDGTTTNRLTPIQIPGLTNGIAIAAGDHYSMVLKGNGTVWAFGHNNAGQLGDGTFVDKYTPFQIQGLTQITNITAGIIHAIALKSNGTIWSWGGNLDGTLGNGLNVQSSQPVQAIGLTEIVSISGGLRYTMALKSDGSVWSCGYNGWGQLGDGTIISKNIPVEITSLCKTALPPSIEYKYNLSGYVYGDNNGDCNRQIGEYQLPFPITLKTTPQNLLTFTTDSGYYSLGINDSINYVIEPIIPQYLEHTIKSICPPNYSVYLNSNITQDTTGFDFAIDYEFCPLLTTDISSIRRRRCFENKTYVSYCNQGFADATNVQVHVEFPEYVDFVSADHTYTIDVDGNYVFDIGTLAQGNCGTIHIIDSVACVNGITGLTQCTKAWITPSNTCADSLDPTFGPWDKSSIKVPDGVCIGDSIVRLVIWNHGSGDMTSNSEYRIYSDNQLVYTGSFQLLSDDSLVLEIAANGSTIRLEADQHPLHPGNSHPRTTVKGCGNGGLPLLFGLLNDTQMDDADVDVEIHCLEIIDSYDPNDKTISPEGITSNRYTKPGTQLDYVIRFQNTGSDTAYTIVIIDTLSPDLDISTIQWGVSSHPYTIDVTGQGLPVVSFTFNNIDLPDSTSDEANSQGFLKFEISPDTSITNHTVIHNKADIYFDFNLPIKTNDAWVTILDTTIIGNPITVTIITPDTTSEEEDNIFDDLSSKIRVVPNPFSNEFTILSTAISTETTSKAFLYNTVGKRMEINYETIQNKINFDGSNLIPGIYFVELRDQYRIIGRAKIVKN